MSVVRFKLRVGGWRLFPCVRSGDRLMSNSSPPRCSVKIGAIVGEPRRIGVGRLRILDFR
jgi:hypothetical protein